MFSQEIPWAWLKQAAAEAGFKDDGFGDIAASDWTAMARLWLAIQEKAAQTCESMEWTTATRYDCADRLRGKSPGT